MLLFQSKICISAISEIENGSFSSSPYNSGTETYSKTLSTGTNNILLITIHNNGGGTITGITWNGVSLTKCSTATRLWYLLNPDSGTHDIIVTHGNAYTILGAYNHIENAKQQAPEAQVFKSGYSSSSSYNTAISETITTLTDGALIYGALGFETGNKQTDGANEFTILYPVGLNNATNTLSVFIEQSYLLTNAGNVTMNGVIFDKSKYYELNIIAFEEYFLTTSRRFLQL